MGNSACPFTWGTSCQQGKARYIQKLAFSYTELDRQLNQYHRPVILKMVKGVDTHWVLVTNGSGDRADNYLMHDPWYPNGRDLPLVDLLNGGWRFTEMAVYEGQPACGPESASAQIDTPIIQVAETEPGVSGTVMVHRREGPNMYVQFHAQSEFGSIAEMKVWGEGESEANAAWLPYDALIQMSVADRVYARFRDEHGNLSEVYSDSIDPTFSPPNSEVFYPVYLPLMTWDHRSPGGD